MGKLDDVAGATNKWATAMAGATTAYTAGINGVQTAPGQLAAQASAKYLARVQARVAAFEKNSAAVTLADWKTAAIDKGAPRLASGAAAAKTKVSAFQTSFFAYLKSGQSQINAMPTTTLEESILKSAAQQRWNAAYPGYR